MEQGFLVSKRISQPAATEHSECGFLRRRALEICNQALGLHTKGLTAKAIPIYSKSIRLMPTAEAHASLGWAYSAHHRYDLAIRECEKAIAVDPEYGNSYNDIGSYLVSQGKLESSIEWFEKAKQATRYDSRYFPYMNLGRVYQAKGMYLRAIHEFQKALQFEPGEESCLAAVKELRAKV
ncbi:MAG: tetratricopeptide repeat protein [Cryobacterium sp.]|nr:tetratricopeptide repeat protein [Oligoflexia bacterium]